MLETKGLLSIEEALRRYRTRRAHVSVWLGGYPGGLDPKADGSRRRPTEPHWWKLVGLLLTAVAASLGAPFWFDALNKIGSLRNVGKKPESSS